jgi:phenylalanyl-tRNA synthetase alpha chain
MSENIDKIINELHIYEKKLLKELELNEDATPDEIAQNTGLNIKSVMSAAGSLASKDIIIVKKDVHEQFSLTDYGKKYAEIGLPERRILKVLQDKKELAMKDLANMDNLEKKEMNISIGWLIRKSWAKMDK